MEDKLLTILARLGAAIITGGGLLTFTNGAWIGRLVLGAFERTTQIRILNEHLLSDDLYREWGRQILFESASEAVGLAAVLYLPLLLLLVGHVLYKATVCDGGSPALGGAGRLAGAARRLCAFYVGHYHLLTLALVFVLGALLATTPSRGALVSRFILFAVPVGLYLAYYVKDMRSPSFKDAFLYFANVVLFCAAAFALPTVFGQRFFDVEMRQTPQKSNAGDTSYLASFVVDEGHQVVGHIYGQDRLTLELEQVDDVRAGISSVSLRRLATDTEARKIAEPSTVAPEIDRLLAGSSSPQ
jgi:hypothetical protein